MALDLDALLAEVEGPQRRAVVGQDAGSGVCQRWQNRRDFYRSTAERFDPARWRVAPMAGKTGLPGGLGRRDTWAKGKAFIVRNHYAGSFPQMRIMIGMFRASDAELVGIATFGNVKLEHAAKYGDVGLDEIVELNRFVLLDAVPGNAETWFLARATALARELHALRGHQLKVLLSYSDPVPRRSLAGFLTMPGHIGNIYQAHNAIYVGYSAPKTLYLDRHGTAPDGRMLSKIRSLDRRSPERGSESAARRFVAQYGAPERQIGESYADWVIRAFVSPAFRAVPHGGNLTYLWALGGKRLQRTLEAAFPPAMSYPKTPRQLYLNSHRKYERAWSRGNVPEIAERAAMLLDLWLALDAPDREGVPAPPQIGATCEMGGSQNRPGLTLGQLVNQVVC